MIKLYYPRRSEIQVFSYPGCQVFLPSKKPPARFYRNEQASALSTASSNKTSLNRSASRIPS